MSRPRFGSRKTARAGDYVESEPPERKSVTFRDFRKGYTPSEQRHMVDAAASPNMHDFIIRPDNRLQRAPGTLLQFNLGVRQPTRMFLHPTLNAVVELGLVHGNEIGFRNTAGVLTWYDLGMADRDEFAHTVFGGTLIFTDGINSWYRDASGAPINSANAIPMARTYTSFGGRVYAGGTLIDGQFEPLGIAWSSADSNYLDWIGFGSGNELLINDTTVGDRIVKIQPMGLDLAAIVNRQSVWLGRFTGQALRPMDVSVRVPGVGAVNERTIVLTHFGVMFLSDNGVYLFDGNTVSQISEPIRPELLPLNFEQLSSYHATYDPVKKHYVLFTPTHCLRFELEYGRWLKRSFTCLDSVVYPTQIDGVRWLAAMGAWADQAELIWLDFAGENIGKLDLFMMGDQTLSDESFQRVVSMESYRSKAYFGECMRPYWESKLFDEQDAQRLVSSKKQLVEYMGSGRICLSLPNEDNQYEQVVVADLAERSYPSLAVFNAAKVGKGTGIAICLELECEPEDPISEPPSPETVIVFDLPSLEVL